MRRPPMVSQALKARRRFPRTKRPSSFRRTAIRDSYENAELVRAVRFGVVTAGLGMMLLGVAGMAMRAVGVVGGLLVVAGFMMLGGFTVMLGRVLVVFGGLVVMLDGMLAHVSLPVGD